MPDDARLELTRAWLRYAREDLEGAEHVVANLPTLAPRHACFFAQQSAEKALKAVLIFLQIEYPRLHNLDELRDLIPAGWSVKTDYPTLKPLAVWAVEARYFSELPDATPDDARETTRQARTIYASVTADLVEHGLSVTE
jgi:HEPN domain-containing protein